LTEHYYTEVPLSKISIFTITPTIRNRPYKFKTCSGVFSYKKVDKGTQLLLNHVVIPDTASNVLDMGTGYGIIGIIIAAESPHIQMTMIDINQRAVWIARENLKINKITNAKVYSGNFFAPIKQEKFDVILSNPPLSLGQKIMFEFISNAVNYLTIGGYFYFVVRTKQGAKKMAEKMTETFGNVSLLKIQGGYRLFRAQKK
jgi:16S rRNA (guanine1207-N2)-methyltransferase